MSVGHDIIQAPVQRFDIEAAIEAIRQKRSFAINVGDNTVLLAWYIDLKAHQRRSVRVQLLVNGVPGLRRGIQGKHIDLNHLDVLRDLLLKVRDYAFRRRENIRLMLDPKHALIKFPEDHP